MHGSELIKYCQKVCVFQTEQSDVVFIKFQTFHVAIVWKRWFTVHLFGNTLICASTVLECSCCRIHRYVAAPFLPLSGVHSIMMEKFSQGGEGGDARPPPVTISTIKYKVVVYTTAERAGTLPYFCSTPIYSLWSLLRGWEWAAYAWECTLMFTVSLQKPTTP